MLQTKVKRFAFGRLMAVMVKEFIQAARDKATFAMMIGIPIIQLLLFGYAINSNPKHLPTVLVSADSSPLTRSILHGMQNTDYFKFLSGIKTEKQAHDLLQSGDASFIVNIPANFTQDVVRGKKPTLLVQADATDPIAAANAISSLGALTSEVLNKQLTGPLAHLKPQAAPFSIAVHSVYNPLIKTQYNIVPGLLGVVLTMTLVIITALAITRERERGTIEMLLSTPVHPLEVMVGKLVPYIIIGYVQVLVILLVAFYLFHVPMLGSLTLLLLCSLPFIAANLAVGLTFSTLAKNQLQAMQGAMFFFLPSILLSGFMFPFKGMPEWAQWIGNILPLTHFLKIVRGIMLKGSTFGQIENQVWIICIFAVVVIFIAVKRYRNKLD